MASSADQVPVRLHWTALHAATLPVAALLTATRRRSASIAMAISAIGPGLLRNGYPAAADIRDLNLAIRHPSEAVDSLGPRPLTNLGFRPLRCQSAGPTAAKIHMIAIRVVSRDGNALASPLAAEFGDAVGDIGRGAECTLVLPDPERQISRKQVLITSRAGRYFICAIGSRQMVELDGALLSPDAEYPLTIGASIRIGPYQLCVEEVAAATESEAAPANLPLLSRAPRIAPSVAMPPAVAPPRPPVAAPPRPPVPGPPQPPVHARPQPPVPASAARSAQGSPPREAARPRAAPPPPAEPQRQAENVEDPLAIFGGSVRASRSSLFADLLDTSVPVRSQTPPAPPIPDHQPTAAPGDNQVDRAGASIVKAPAASVPPSAAAADRSTEASGLPDGPTAAALYRGLDARIPGLEQLSAEHARLAGALLRTLLIGTLELLAARTIAKRELGANSTMLMARENNPLKFSPDVDAALAHLLGPPERGFISPLDAVRDAFSDLRAHQVAVLAGMRAALDEVLARFDPQALEQRLAPGALWDKVVPASRKAKLWEAYAERYADILREVEGDFDTLFGRAFAQAYKAQMEQLANRSGDDAGSES